MEADIRGDASNVIVYHNIVGRCEGGLAGLQRQGVCNAFLSKMIMRHDKVFMVRALPSCHVTHYVTHPTI